MIISPQRRFIFIEIPHVGSAPLARAIVPHLSPKHDLVFSHTLGDIAIWARQRFELEKLGLNKYSTLADLEKVFGEEELLAHQLMTVIRNPFDRLARYYETLRKWPSARFGEVSKIAHGQDFDGFVRSDLVMRWMSQNYASHVRFSSGREHCQAYIKSENLGEINAVLDGLKMPTLNEKPDDFDFRSYYSDALVEFVSDHLAYDLVRFEYQFE